ncbi:MAG: hypothetical protein Q7U97_01080 [Rhodocyclaceae bacterium]|nr:hypothetical protein [Rhodocyclaceae bacterium]
MNKSIAILLTLALAGCGAETAGTAATVAALKAKEIRQGEETQKQVVEQLDAANRLADQRRKDADGK